MAAILTLHDAGVALQGRTIVSGVSLALEEGQTLAVLGPNGAGKTVLLRALLGLTPHLGLVRWAADARLGYVPQHAEADRHLPIHLCNLLEAKASVQGLTGAGLNELGAAVGLDAGAMRMPLGRLSGGQFQRALMALALLGQPNVLLLDEPTASLDEPGEERLYELIHRLQRERTLTVVLVSHDLSHVYRYADRVLCLNRTALCVGTPHEALTPESLERLFGGPTKFYHTEHNQHA